MTRGIRTLSAVVGNHRDRASSDHEPILGEAVVVVPPGPKHEVIWCARELTPGCGHLLDTLPAEPGDLHALTSKIAKAITRPANRSAKFHESPELKQLRRSARQAEARNPAKAAWKQVRRSLQQERRCWKQTLANRAGQQDWSALRSLKHKDANSNWAARLLDDPAWSDKLPCAYDVHLLPCPSLANQECNAAPA